MVIHSLKTIVTKKLPLLFVFFCFLAIISRAQTRGALPGEIYIAGEKYMGYEGMHYAIFFSAKNGNTLTLKYEHVENQPGVILMCLRAGKYQY
jgi:hypothetical protein